MSRPKRFITCVCCGQRGRVQARRLIARCYSYYKRRGALDRFPPIREAKLWQPVRSDSSLMVQRYQELAATRPAPSKTWIAWELGVSERSIERYAAAVRAQQATPETTQPRTEAA